ncbi:MAG: twin-arginine translocase TatA/TatE family subunit [Planctomycetes bacterium]|nr:twin-arginine translocase TatA/TatE family subunit [Planctomycetota bacterium]
MEFFGLSFAELVVIFVVAILVFGQRLPQVAGETAATLQRVRRSLSDLRRETGIDQEIQKAKREFEDAQRGAQASVQREAAMLRAEVERAANATSAAPATSETPTAATPAPAAAPVAPEQPTPAPHQG